MAAYQSKIGEKLVLSGKNVPDGEGFKEIANHIFHPENPKQVKYIVKAKGEKPPLVIHCLARHEDVSAILKGGDDVKVNLSHYDTLLHSAADDVRFLLGEEINLDQRWGILKDAMELAPPMARTLQSKDGDEYGCPMADKPNLIEEIAAEAVAAARKHNFNPKNGKGEFNAVREYGYLVPYLVSKRLFGLELPQKPSFWLRVFMGLRNFASPGRVQLTGDVTPASRLLMWTHMIFGHLFANVGGRKKLVKFFATKSSENFKAHIDHAQENPDSVPEDSLLGRFIKNRPDKNSQDPSLEEYDKLVRSLIFEFSGTMQILVGTSFANILKTIREQKIGLPKFLELLEEPGNRVLDEALRLNPTTELVYRIASEDFYLGDRLIKKDEHICLMVGYACKDKTAFANPDQFIVDPDHEHARTATDYLNFGPYESEPNTFNPTDGTHPCFGQYWARIILKSMLHGLNEFPNLSIESKKGSVLSRFMEIPDSIKVKYGKLDQNFVTVVSEICTHDSATIDEIESKMEALGNPATDDIKAKLDACGRIHFMSLNVVKGDKARNEPSHIFFELSVDGKKEDALAVVCDYLGEDLYPIFSLAGYLNPLAEEDEFEQSHYDLLFDHLAASSVDIVQSVWPQFYSGSWRNGLAFTGTPGMSIEQIKDEHIIAEHVKKYIRKSGGDNSPITILKNSETNLSASRKPEIQSAITRWVDEDLDPPVFAEVAESPWKSTWDTVTLAIKATPDVVKVWTFLLFLGSASMIWSLLFQNHSASSFTTAEPSSLAINAWSLFSGIIFAFIFSVILSLVSVKVFRMKYGKTGSIFAFMLFIFGYFALKPEKNTNGLSGIEAFYNSFLIRPESWVIALAATAIVAVFIVLSKATKLRKAGPALGASFLMALLALTIIEMQSGLMSANGAVLTQKRWGFFDASIMSRWNTASLGQMIFYPLLLTAGLVLSIFAFNSSFPWFQNLIRRQNYKWLFASVFTILFLTSFASLMPIGWERLATFFLSFILAIPVTLVTLAVLALGIWQILKLSERKNVPIDRDPAVDKLAEIQAREDKNHAQNHMISVQTLVPEQWRTRFFLPLALHIVGIVLFKQRYRPGFLASVGTVHFARWVHIANTNRLIFVSNYDGSWESYLEDFITKSATGMTGIWSNCKGFPRTKNLFFEGAADGDRFKRWARESMQPTSFWYSAYPHLTAEKIRSNTLIRDGLARIKTPSDAEAWIDLFGSIPRPDFALQSEKIQSLVFGASGNLKLGAALMVKSDVVSGTDLDFQKWVKHISKDITFGDGRPTNPAIYVGFTAAGMALLGCDNGLAGDLNDNADCIKFPPAFNLGMDSDSRERILGDIAEKDRPKNWDWGVNTCPCSACNKDNPNQTIKCKFNPTHAVLLIYGNNSETVSFDELLAEHKTRISDRGLTVSRTIKFDEIPDSGPMKEPFGYVDGISQPVIKGSKRSSSYADSIHLVSPGEFILGYKDNRGHYPPSPQVSADFDKISNYLPAIPKAQPQRYPRFQSEQEDKYRDIGRNGTYLVIRQLEQDVAEFEKCVTKAASKFDCESSEKAEEIIKAKLMGRWTDGQSLLKKPIKLTRKDGMCRLESSYRPTPERPDNEFLLGAEDPQGYNCPYGSHIRRTNPRDSLDVENPDGLSIVNRHRILRRGRPYTDEKRIDEVLTEDPDEPVYRRGTMFMCLNADIERQFEFIQQTWVGSCTFHGLDDEIDPISGQGYYQVHPSKKEAHFKTKGLGFTIQDPERSERLKSFKSLITVRGGGYFFIPSKEALEFIGNNKICS